MTALRIQILILLDSICTGLFAFITPHITNIGGNNTIVGIYAVAVSICMLLSADIVRVLTNSYGKRSALYIILLVATLSHVIIALTSSCWLLILARCLYSLTSQAQHFYRDMLVNTVTEEDTEYYLSTYSILGSCGYIIGPTISGCLFDIGFSYSCVLAVLLMILSISLLLTIPISTDVSNLADHTPFAGKILDRISGTIDKFNKAAIEENWDMILMKFLFSTGVIVFFTKYTHVLKHNLLADSTTIGIMISYMNALIFAGSYFVTLFPTSTYFSDYALMIMIFSTTLACLSTSYLLYLIMCIPIIVCRCYMNTIWNHLFDERENRYLTEIDNSIGIIADLTVPLIFGILRDIVGFYIVPFFSIAPLILSAHILKQYSRTLLAESDSKEKEL